MNNLDLQYQNLLKDILENGVKKGDRTGTGTISVFGRTIRHKMSEGFPLLTTKKMFTKGIITELIWFLKGDTNIRFLVQNGCHIWDGDAYKNYEKYMVANPSETRWCKILSTTEIPGVSSGASGCRYTKEEFIEQILKDEEFAKQWGDLGSVYGKQWKNWATNRKISVRDGQYPNGEFKWKYDYAGIDQIANLINDLKNNPDSRRLMVNAWNVPEIPNCVLPPCHYGFQVYTRELSFDERFALFSKWTDGIIFVNRDKMSDEKINEMMDMAIVGGVPKRAISLMWQQRSVDTFLGLPFNIASYGFLLDILAKEVNMIPDELIGNLGDTHLYLNHIEPANKQLLNTPYELPTLAITKHDGQEFSCLGDIYIDNFQIQNYKSHDKIEAPLSN